MSLFRFRLMACVFTLGVLGLLCASTVQAQPGQGRFGGQGGPRGGNFGGGPGGGGAMALLLRNDVQEELELLDDQKQQLRGVAEKSRERMGELFGRGNDGGNQEARRDAFRKFAEETQAELDKVLLPHQSKRLKQLEVQSRMRFGINLGGDIASQLGISETDQDKLRDKARGLEQELAKKTAEIRKQLQEQLIADLSADQKAQFKEMVGEPFEFKDEPGGPGFPGGFRGQRAPGGGEGRPGGGEGRPRRGNN